MAPAIATYPTPDPFRPSIGRTPSEPVPATDELEALQRQLQLLRTESLDRARKASEDLKTIEDSMRKLKEREKGKAKAAAAAEKIKRERGFTPLASDTEPLRSSLPPNSSLPARPSFAAPNLNARPTPDPRKSKPNDMKAVTKKKKRKRDEEESGEDSDSPLKVTKVAPSPAAPRPFIPPKPPPPTNAFTTTPSKASTSTGQDFSEPPQYTWLPPRPHPNPTPKPGPSKPTDVTEDFSKAKQPTQVPVATFYTSIEPYLRPIREEDVGFLEWHADEVEPYILPRLGRHYSEQWEDEDLAAHGTVLPTTAAIRASASYGRVAPAPPHPRWDPATLADPDLIEEERGHGPLTERLVSALLPVEGAWKGVKAAEELMEGRHGVGVGNAAARQVIVEDLERRIRDSLRYHSILDEKPDFTEPVDDPIATALRHAQSELRTTSALNKARKLRLSQIARDRVGYQEYLESRDALDKAISTTYARLQRKDGPNKHAKKKSHKKGAAAAAQAAEEDAAAAAQAVAGQWPAALGLGPDEEGALVVPEQLARLVDARELWDGLAEAMLVEQVSCGRPDAVVGLPERSVYEGLEEEVRAALVERSAPASGSATGKAGAGQAQRRNGAVKGKAKAVDPNAMDVG